MSVLKLLLLIGGYPTRARMHRRYRQFCAAADDCRGTQERTLRRILRLNAGSEFSRRFRLDGVQTVEQFRRQWSNAGADFECFRPWVERVERGDTQALLGPRNRLLMFGVSSGTTSRQKRVPITVPFLNDYRRGWQIWSSALLRDHPPIRFGKFLQISSSHQRARSASGIPCGNISGLVAALQSPLVRGLYPVPLDVNAVDDPDTKLYLTLLLSIACPDVRLVMTANPSTLVRLGELAAERTDDLIRTAADGKLPNSFAVPETLRQRVRQRLRSRATVRRLERSAGEAGVLRPKDIWPLLEAVSVWTGGTCRMYLDRLRSFFGDVPVRDHGLSATEGRMTIPLENNSPSGVLDIDAHFFEFIPHEEYGGPQPTVLQAHELTVGRTYNILLTTVSGLYRYDICDVVRCDGFFKTTPCLSFLHKGAHISNITGEKLTEHQVVDAMHRVSRALNLDLPQFSVAPRWSDLPHYVLFAEESRLPLGGGREQLAAAFDLQLQECNSEYHEKRRSHRLGPVECVCVADGFWKEFAARRRREKDACFEQYKHPYLLTDAAAGAALMSAERFAAAAKVQTDPSRIADRTRDGSVADRT